MRLLFKQRIFTWFDSYDIYDENQQTVYTVKGQLSWGHCLHISDRSGYHVGTVKEKIFTWLPAFEIYEGETYMGRITKEFSFFKPAFSLDFKGWTVEGDWFEWDYQIMDGGRVVATVSKELFHWADTYVIDVRDPEDALYVLMIVLAIDAEKCSRN